MADFAVRGTAGTFDNIATLNATVPAVSNGDIMFLYFYSALGYATSGLSAWTKLAEKNRYSFNIFSIILESCK